MSKSINDKMVNLAEIIRVLNHFRHEADTGLEVKLIDQIEKKILGLEHKKRLIIIDGGKK